MGFGANPHKRLDKFNIKIKKMKKPKNKDIIYNIFRCNKNGSK